MNRWIYKETQEDNLPFTAEGDRGKEDGKHTVKTFREEELLFFNSCQRSSVNYDLARKS